MTCNTILHVVVNFLISGNFYFLCFNFISIHILGDPGAVSRVDKMFMVKVHCKITTNILSTQLTAPGSLRMWHTLPYPKTREKEKSPEINNIYLVLILIFHQKFLLVLTDYLPYRALIKGWGQGYPTIYFCKEQKAN